MRMVLLPPRRQWRRHIGRMPIRDAVRLRRLLLRRVVLMSDSLRSRIVAVLRHAPPLSDDLALADAVIRELGFISEKGSATDE